MEELAQSQPRRHRYVMACWACNGRMVVTEISDDTGYVTFEECPDCGHVDTYYTDWE